MPKRLLEFESGDYYHLCNKSISNYQIFNNNYLKQNFLNLLEYCNNPDHLLSFSVLKRKGGIFVPKGVMLRSTNFYVDFISYCIMPDHYHLLIRSNVGDLLLNEYIGRVQNSHTKTVNGIYDRKGPLWQSRFRAVKIETNEQLIHTVRYININPCTNGLVKIPQEWEYSTAKYLMNQDNLNRIPEISINSAISLGNFFKDNINYQRKLHIIKRLTLE